MNWTDFPTYAYTAAALWLAGVIFVYLGIKNKILTVIGTALVFGGLLAIGLFIGKLWLHLDRPPMRTLGETRLWYAFFLPGIGLLFFLRWKYRWFLAYAIMMSYVFLIINLTHPETYDKTLMPALQSPWFVPHVVVYIFGYAMLGVSTLVALKGLYQHYFTTFDDNVLLLADNLVYLGFGFLTLGLLFGALWAKQAWGHYWTWDPKETWAFLTWLGYLIYIHLRFYHPRRVSGSLWVLSLAFVVLMIAWFGINYLPSAQNSVHVYAG
ncbi:MAG TPA: cytochrome c biogenesis protein CcsA [Bacteroidales bacterium]|nr:cytochrome c biogenesis protein CcsA [Bacteroidales bacterium]